MTTLNMLDVPLPEYRRVLAAQPRLVGPGRVDVLRVCAHSADLRVPHALVRDVFHARFADGDAVVLNVPLLEFIRVLVNAPWLVRTRADRLVGTSRADRAEVLHCHPDSVALRVPRNLVRRVVLARLPDDNDRVLVVQPAHVLDSILSVEGDVWFRSIPFVFDFLLLPQAERVTRAELTSVMLDAATVVAPAAASDDSACAICLAPLSSSEATAPPLLRTLRCAHRFHRACFDEWAAQVAHATRPSCPLCRAPVFADDQPP
jgi:hypothetical protein